MNRNAAYREPVNSRLFQASIAALLSLAMLFAGLGATASAAPMGKDGKLYACYKVKGKPKGAVRVVPGAKARCRRGERKVVWNVAGSSGQAGATGQAGTNGSGQQGEAGSTGTTSSNEAILKSEVAGLELKVAGLEDLLQGFDKGDLSGLPGRVDGLEGVLDGVSNSDLTGALSAVDGLEGVLQGVTNSDLTGALDTLEGVTNTELLDTVASLPALELVCDQNLELAEQANLLRTVVGGLGLEGVLGGLLKIPTLPSALNLNQFGCPAS